MRSVIAARYCMEVQAHISIHCECSHVHQIQEEHIYLCKLKIHTNRLVNQRSQVPSPRSPVCWIRLKVTAPPPYYLICWWDVKRNSNTPPLYSQWLNSVIYWLINHCTDWSRTDVTSFSCQFDFYDVIYHNRRCNVVFTTT